VAAHLFPDEGEVVPVSAATGDGLLALKRRLLGMIAVSLAAAPPEVRA
jgi:hypothetical protein